MKKICILSTGGTIGMLSRNRTSYIPAQPINYKSLYPSLSSLADIDYDHLFSFDSSNIGIKEWSLIAQAIARRQEEYDGFVVCHGTDSMVYTASALAYAFGPRLNYPIVFTGAQRTPDSPESDAEANITAAVRLAMSELAEVVIAFHKRAWRACRTTKISNSQKQAYDSPLTPPLAHVEDEVFLHPHARRRRKDEFIRPQVYFSNHLYLFQAIPGHDKPSLLACVKEPSWQLGLVIGMGNANVPSSFIDFITAAVTQGKEIIIAPSVADSAPTTYPPLRTALAKGALLATGYIGGGLWTKLSWLLGRSAEKQHQKDARHEYLKEYLIYSFIGEIHKE